MIATDFINKWRNSINYLNLPSVGIHVGWDIIPANSKVENLTGEEAWRKIYTCTPPWFKIPQTFRQLIDTRNSDYSQIVKEETDNGKIEYYRQNGLQEPFFCAFTNDDELFMMLGDGNHRFFDCSYLIDQENHDFEADLEKVNLDIIYLENFEQVIEPEKIWGQVYNKK